VVSQLRPKTGAAKEEKDLDQAALLAHVLEERFPGLVEDTATRLQRPALRLAVKGARVAAARTAWPHARDVFSRLAGRHAA
jgi:hypothetical protein